MGYLSRSVSKFILGSDMVVFDELWWVQSWDSLSFRTEMVECNKFYFYEMLATLHKLLDVRVGLTHGSGLADLERGVSSEEIRRATLIPKVTDAKFVNDYRPISLIGSVYKVVTKIMATRCAEVLHWCKRKNKKVMFFKVDFAKAYDSVRWDFLIDVLEAFGFGSTWCNWVRGTFCYAKGSILVNGSPSNEFQFHRGLKQGDPLSPYLFILVMESLHLSVCRAMNDRSVRGGVEKDQLSVLADILDTVSLSSSLDRWACLLSSDGEFCVKDVRSNIDDMFLPSYIDSTRGCCIGVDSAVALLGRRMYPIALFQCPLAQAVLRQICRWWEVPWQQWASFSEWTVWFSDIRLKSKIKSLFEGVFMVAWWAIWGFRNRSIFEISPPNRSLIFDDIVSHSFLWCHNRSNRSFSWNSWLKNPHLISL
ncbi:RNA-directed DNA polymerase, eukaryota [Tanacetum coccineum]|uniref:RNA-directed DNA polymerase, eukaryota n=1 Tax=Tanacetum coccineum TaxID=301880 RepID=A0ABQ5BD50_9ASTR